MRHFIIAAGIGLGAITATGARGQDFAPDGTQIAVPWSGSGQLVNVETGALTPIPRGEEAARTSWSPNGRFVVFVTGGGETSMRLYDTRTNSTRVLGANLDFPVAWREDSGRLAMFHTLPTGKTELIQYGVGERGIALRVNVASPPDPSAPMVWLPTTDNVAFVARDGNVYTVEEAEIKKITTSSDVIGMGLSGNKKSLVWARRGPNPRYILVTFYAYDLTSRSVRRLEMPGQIPGINNARQAPASIERVAISPDGARAALAVTLSQPGAKGQPAVKSTAVYVVRMDGTGARLVTTSAASARLTPFWAGNGKMLAIHRSGQPGAAVIVADADGSGARAVLGSLK